MLAGAFGLLLALALVVSLAAPAFAVPLQPHQFYGDVTIDYVQAPEGTTISAQIDGVEYGATTVDAFGRYGHTPNFFVSAEDPDVAGKQGGINGDTVMFYVGGVYAGNVTFAIGGATELDLALGEVVQYTLTVDSTDCGNATGPGEGDFIYNAGTDVPLVAEAWADCCFVNWTGDVATVADVNAASTTITMNGDYSITANFVSKVVLTAASGTGGTVTVPGEGDFPYCPDDVADITAVPDAGYEFASWTGDVGTVADANAASTTITMDADYSVMANFNFVGTNTLTTASTAGGAVTEPGEPGPFTYSTGAVVDLLAVADTGYAFVDWTGDVTTVGDVEDADTTITVDGDYSIQANFEQVQVMYTLTLQVLPIGTGVTTPAIGDHDYAADTVVPISAVAGTNYVFSSWTGDVANPLSQNTSVTMDADKTVTANFSFTGGGGGGYFPPATATPTPTASPTPSPTPVVTPTPTPVVTPPPLPPIPPFDLTDVIDENGVVGEDASYEAPEGQLGISIGAGTTAKTAAGEPVEEIEITEVCVNIPPPPANAYIVGCAYDFGPDGATFDPPITITISYDPGQIPSGVAEGDLVIAYYDVSAGQWVTLATTVDTATHELSAEVDGFTLFAAYGEGEVAPTPPPATPTPPPVTPTPTPAPEEAGTNVGVIIGPIIAVIVIGIVAYWFLRRRGQAEE